MEYSLGFRHPKLPSSINVICLYDINFNMVLILISNEQVFYDLEATVSCTNRVIWLVSVAMTRNFSPKIKSEL